ncbi:MAG: TRAP transporter substrate-binding protein DctP [Polyangiaceae bacterium]
MVRKWILAALAATSIASFTTGTYADDPPKKKPTVIKIGTLAPEFSPWGTVFRVWAKAVKEKSKGELVLDFYWNGTAGDERTMVGNIRSGLLSGAAVTANGLADIYKNVLVLQMPGLAESWDELDKARAAIMPLVKENVEKQGFRVVGIGDVGEAHLMTKGFKVLRPSDLKADPAVKRDPHLFAVVGDEIAPKLYETIGVDKYAKLSVPEILASLGNGTVNVINAPSLAAVQLQWAANLDHLNLQTTGYAIGALVFSGAKLDALSDEQREILKSTGEVASKALTERIRGEDKKAFEDLKSKMTTYKPERPEDVKAWKTAFAATRAKLRGTVFDAKAYDAVMQAVGK